MERSAARPLRRQYSSDIAPVQRRELWAWAMFDFANSGYTTVVITAVFNAYFVGVIAAGSASATLQWTSALALSYALIMFSAPLIGALADQRANKKRWLAASATLCVLCTALLTYCGPGDVLLALVLVVLSNFAFGTGENLIAAYLPELADEHGVGRLSGYGWALGYAGGLLVLAFCLYWIQSAEEAQRQLAVRQTMLITALTFALAAIPTFVFLVDRQRPLGGPATGALRAAWAEVRSSLASADGLVDLRRFLVCIVAYQAGVGTVITVAAIYTQEALGFTTADSIMLIMVVNLTAAAGAFAFGLLQDRFGHRLSLALSLLLWLAALALLWASEGRAMVWFAANLAGLSLGASQSAGRALVAYLCPPGRQAEIFGLWGLAVKLSMIIGPLAYGLISWLAGDHRQAMLATAGFFIAGLILLARVDVQRGRARALAAGPAP